MNEGVINLFAVAALVVVVALTSGFIAYIGYMAPDIRDIIRDALVARKRDEPDERRTRD